MILNRSAAVLRNRRNGVRRFGSSVAALAALAHLALQGPNAMMSTFQQHQRLI